MPHVQDPGESKEINTANPRICQTDFAGLIAGTRVTRMLFHKYFPKKRRTKKIKNTVKNETIARRPGEASTRPFPSKVSVWENAALIAFATAPPIIFLCIDIFIKANI